MEIWKTTIESDRYEASNYGNIRSKLNKTNLSLRKQSNYLYWGRREGGIYKKAYVHRTIYQAFNNVIPNGYHINHLDFNGNNNNLSNLESITHLENIQYSRKAGRYNEAQKKHSKFMVIENKRRKQLAI
jgi:hypothetical protein